MLRLSVKGDYKKVLKDMKLVESKLTARARQAALRKTAAAIRKETLKRTAGEIGLPQKFIRKRFKVFSHPRTKSVDVWAGLQKIPLISITGGMSPRAAARFMHNVEGRAFMATMPGGHVGWYQRKSNAMHKPGRNKNPQRPELPIAEVKLDYSQAAEKQLLRTGDELGPRLFPREFETALQKQLARNRPYAR